MAFGRWIRIIRRRMGMTQADLSLLLGIHWTTLSRWERGLAQPSLGELLEISRRYVAYAVNLDGWIHSRPGKPLEEPGKVAVFSDRGSPILGTFLERGLHRGDKVIVAYDGRQELEAFLAELCAEVGDWSTAIRSRQIEPIQLGRVWGGNAGGFHPRVAVADMVEADLRAREAGYSGARWVVDLRPLRGEDELVAKLVTVNQAVDVFFHMHGEDRALAVYPPQVLDDRLGGILLSLQPKIVVAEGVVENPYFGDRYLTTAIRLLEVTQLDAPLVDQP